MKLIPCSKEEFDAFIASYHRPLVHDVLRTVEPERIQYNDFTLGNWPDSVVALLILLGGICEHRDQ